MARFANHFMAALVVFFGLGQIASAAQPPNQATTQTAPSSEAAPATSGKAHGAMPAELTKSLDSKKLKDGDPVAARITAELRMRSGETIPRDSKLIGHVTEAKARSKGDPQAALGIVFDKITTPSGKDMAIKGVIQAVGPSLTSGGPPNSSSPGIGPGMMAGHDSGITTPPPAGSISQTTQTSVPMLNGQSKGVVGIHNL